MVKDINSLIQLEKEYPVGSKVISTGPLGFCAKVVGYHELGEYLLLYNPMLYGHNGCGVAYNDAFMLMSTKYLESNYGRHLLYYPSSSVKLIQKSAFAILKEELGYD